MKGHNNESANSDPVLQDLGLRIEEKVKTRTKTYPGLTNLTGELIEQEVDFCRKVLNSIVENNPVLVLFDIDGTMTIGDDIIEPRPCMAELLDTIIQRFNTPIGILSSRPLELIGPNIYGLSHEIYCRIDRKHIYSSRSQQEKPGFLSPETFGKQKKLTDIASRINGTIIVVDDSQDVNNSPQSHIDAFDPNRFKFVLARAPHRDSAIDYAYTDPDF